jgi:hypothetical protein
MLFPNSQLLHLFWISGALIPGKNQIPPKAITSTMQLATSIQ